MLTIEVIAVGRVKSTWIQAGISHYTKLLSRFVRVESTIVRDAGPNQATTAGIATEAGRIEGALKDRALVLLLDASGKQFSSDELAQFLAKTQSKYSHLQFVIGGAFGLSPQLVRAGRIRFSLSSFTLPHELCQVVLIEQLYRALSINAGSGYHK